MNEITDHLLKRRSVKAAELDEPGPDAAELDLILRSAHRVPDHKKLGPWRFIVLQGQARERAGAVLGATFSKSNPDCTDKLRAFECERFLRAPLVVAVVLSPKACHKVPRDEQVLSAGAACQNLLIAASSLGYGAQWLTEWYSYDQQVQRAFELDADESFAGFIYIGTAKDKPAERARPSLEERLSYFS